MNLNHLVTIRILQRTCLHYFFVLHCKCWSLFMGKVVPVEIILLVSYSPQQYTIFYGIRMLLKLLFCKFQLDFCQSVLVYCHIIHQQKMMETNVYSGPIGFMHILPLKKIEITLDFWTCSSVDILTIFTPRHFLFPSTYMPSLSWPSLYALSAHHSFLTWKVDFWIFSLVGDRVGCQDWKQMEMQVNSQPLLL